VVGDLGVVVDLVAVAVVEVLEDLVVEVLVAGEREEAGEARFQFSQVSKARPGAPMFFR